MAPEAPSPIGILLTNLGTPDAPTPAALRQYLAEFLSDPRVVERPRWLWWPILHGIILRTRPRRAARAYNAVWTQEGSPLLRISRDQAEALQCVLNDRVPDDLCVALAMRYGSPSIRTGLEALRSAGAERVLVFPLYPQYSATTTASTFDAVSTVLSKWRRIPALRMINDYHAAPGYIDALAASIREYWAQHGQGEKLLLSFHGLPQRYVDAGDPYRDQCEHTARALAEALGLEENRWQLAFQSRFGPEAWLKPYTDETLSEWGKAGIRHVDVVCPGFSADCLETLEEIAVENRDVFFQAGGECYNYIPCLNDAPAHIDFLAELIIQHCRGW